MNKSLNKLALFSLVLVSSAYCGDKENYNFDFELPKSLQNEPLFSKSGKNFANPMAQLVPANAILGVVQSATDSAVGYIQRLPSQLKGFFSSSAINSSGITPPSSTNQVINGADLIAAPPSQIVVSMPGSKTDLFAAPSQLVSEHSDLLEEFAMWQAGRSSVATASANISAPPLLPIIVPKMPDISMPARLQVNEKTIGEHLEVLATYPFRRFPIFTKARNWIEAHPVLCKYACTAIASYMLMRLVHNRLYRKTQTTVITSNPNDGRKNKKDGVTTVNVIVNGNADTDALKNALSTITGQ